MVCVDVNNMLPSRPGFRQSQFDVAECDGDLLFDCVRDLQIVIPPP